MPRSPPKHTGEDLCWWKGSLVQPIITQSIPGPIEVINPLAYSDASSGTGIVIWINGRWWTWHLLPGWNAENQNIGWAEAVGMKFLIITLLNQCLEGSHIKNFGNNCGVIEGWWKGQSWNRATNGVFKHIHKLTEPSHCSFLMCYVPSAHNPADDPSRGIYLPFHLRPFLMLMHSVFKMSWFIHGPAACERHMEVAFLPFMCTMIQNQSKRLIMHLHLPNSYQPSFQAW